MNVIKILENNLKVIGADGLCTDGCGCGIGDLAPCGEWIGECVPAKFAIATEPGEWHDVGDKIYIEMELPPNATNQGG
jgi:hypothetical protein